MPAGDDGPVAAAELAVFVREHFMKDAQLAKQHPAANSKAYWVRRRWEELHCFASFSRATGVVWRLDV